VLLSELDIDLESIDDYNDLYSKVEDGLNNSFDSGVDGVTTV